MKKLLTAAVATVAVAAVLVFYPEIVGVALIGTCFVGLGALVIVPLMA